MRLYGWYRNSVEITRVAKTIQKGDKSLMVDRDLDIRKDEMIAVLTSSFDAGATERHIVESYDRDSGEMKLKGTEFAYWHYGQ